jgi:hypothetical protein
MQAATGRQAGTGGVRHERIMHARPSALITLSFFQYRSCFLKLRKQNLNQPHTILNYHVHILCTKGGFLK